MESIEPMWPFRRKPDDRPRCPDCGERLARVVVVPLLSDVDDKEEAEARRRAALAADWYCEYHPGSALYFAQKYPVPKPDPVTDFAGEDVNVCNF